MKRIVYRGPRTLSVESGSVPENNTGECIVKVSYVGVCGSDLNIYQGAHPRAKAPLVMGHEISGYIESGHPTLPAGSPVTVFPLLSCGHCDPCLNGASHVCSSLRLIGIDRDGGMTGYARVPIDSIVSLPEKMPLDWGAFVEPLAVGIHAVQRSGCRTGDRTVVFGVGPIGLSVALCLRYFGAASIVLFERNEYRKKIAKELGFSVIDPSTEGDIPDLLRSLTGKPDADLVFDCAAHPSVQTLSLKLTRIQGTMVVVGSYKKPPEVDLLSVEFKEQRILGTRVYKKEDFTTAIEMIESGTIDLAPLLTVFAPEDAGKVFQSLTEGADVIKALFRME